MLGELVKDKVTGFQGIAISEHNYLDRLTQYAVQRIELKEDGSVLQAEYFSKERLEVITEKQSE